MEAAAIRQHRNPLRRHYFERPPNMYRHHVRGFDLVVLHIDHAHAQIELRLELPEEIEIFSTAARKFERQLLDVGIQNGRKKISVAALPGGLAVAIPVADVEADFGVDSLD